MKTTRLITLCLLTIAFSSCTTVRYTQNIVTITPKKDIVRAGIQRIFRTIKKDYAHNAVIAIDRIYLKNTTKVLCLMYICNAKGGYVYDSDWTRFYDSDTPKLFNPIKNISMALEFFYRHCDPISASALQSIHQQL